MTEEVEACSELGCTLSEFGPRRCKSWDELYDREAQYLATEMVKKREVGTHTQSSDDFGAVRMHMAKEAVDSMHEPRMHGSTVASPARKNARSEGRRGASIRRPACLE